MSIFISFLIGSSFFLIINKKRNFNLIGYILIVLELFYKKKASFKYLYYSIKEDYDVNSQFKFKQLKFKNEKKKKRELWKLNPIYLKRKETN